jgi:K+-transporting ATPase ATPase C chain
VRRVAKARNMPENRLRQAVGQQIGGPTLGFFGEPHVNVPALDMALDRAPRRERQDRARLIDGRAAQRH